MNYEVAISRLLCAVCGYVMKPAPTHCGTPMYWVLEGTFRKKEKLACGVCRIRMDIPKHCGLPMWYSEAEYHDLPSPTLLDYESMKEAAREE